ncbi:MAG: hypothetical protein IPJ65_28545 [Archangiaceae bacterium]|nr:hypothetical protein [Archangiaceae bacterium]
MKRELLGFHATPDRVVRALAGRLVRAWESGKGDKSKLVQIADLFAGDGRLGREVSRRLRDRGWRVSVTFVEVDPGRFRGVAAQGGERWIVADALKWKSSSLFDLVVANPPYLRLTVKRARRLGISWLDALAAGRNLYGLGALRCFELCRHGGVVGAVGPFGWTRGHDSQVFRRRLSGLASQLSVTGYSNRSLFAGVHQDIGLAVGTRGFVEGGGTIRVNILSGPNSNVVPISAGGKSGGFTVRCGSVVWNRFRGELGVAGKGMLPLVFGGNIRPDGRVRFAEIRYVGRQYVRQSALREGEVLRGPCLLIRRVMRGRPGAWHVDCGILGAGRAVAAENHVILVTSAAALSVRQWNEIAASLKDRIERCFRTSGQPTLSTRGIAALAALVRNPAWKRPTRRAA